MYTYIETQIQWSFFCCSNNIVHDIGHMGMMSQGESIVGLLYAS